MPKGVDQSYFRYGGRLGAVMEVRGGGRRLEPKLDEKVCTLGNHGLYCAIKNELQNAFTIRVTVRVWLKATTATMLDVLRVVCTDCLHNNTVIYPEERRKQVRLLSLW